MQFLTALFGGSENTVLTAVFALGLVLVLVVMALWAMKVIFKASGNMARGRVRRLTVVDTVQIDARRQMVIVRRDNVEHVILTGGPQDMVVESSVPVERPAAARRTLPAAQQPAAPQQQPVADETQRPGIAFNGGRSPMERLREVGRTTGQRKAPAKVPTLRGTGLLRPVGRPDPAVIPINGYNSDAPAADSATTGPAHETNGQAKLGAATSRGYLGDAFKAEGK